MSSVNPLITSFLTSILLFCFLLEIIGEMNKCSAIQCVSVACCLHKHAMFPKVINVGLITFTFCTSLASRIALDQHILRASINMHDSKKNQRVNHRNKKLRDMFFHIISYYSMNTYEYEYIFTELQLDYCF